MPSPLLATWLPPAHTPATCAGVPSSPPSARRVRATPPLCANGECRAAPKRYAPPTFHHRPRSVRQNNEHRTRCSSPFPPLFHAQAGASSPQQARKAAACHNPCSCTQAEHMNGGGGMPPSPTPVCARRVRGLDHCESQRHVPPLPLWPPTHANEGNRWGREDGNGHAGGVAPPPFACGGKRGPHRNAPTPLLPCPCSNMQRGGGGTQAKQCPSCIACAYDPTCVLRARPCVPCYALTGRSSRREVSLSGVGSGLSALATCDTDMW